MIKVLWAVNIIPSEASKLLGHKKIHFGGWIDTMRVEIEKKSNIQLAIACFAKVDEIIVEKVGNTTYYIIPELNKKDVKQREVIQVLEDYKPDILHMEGTEFPYTRKFLECFKGQNVVSLQGIINGYESYQYGELPLSDMMWSLSPIKILTSWSLHFRKKFLFTPRLYHERESIKMAKNLLGRTIWDRAHAYKFNHNAPYYKCNRILRETFYEKEWRLDDIKKYSLFIGNSYNALKGAHHVFEAVSLLKDEFPSVKVYVAGEPPYIQKGSRNPTKYIGYSVYLRHLIKRLDIEDNVEFIGISSGDEITDYLVKTHIFVLPSTIENSPNSLGEAMLVGVPCVAAYVGGVPDMAIDNKEALLYRSNDPVLLAWKIRSIFKDDNLAISLSENAQLRAKSTHDPSKNANMLIEAYENIIKGES